jgi:PAS domain S-box-containing protein
MPFLRKILFLLALALLSGYFMADAYRRARDDAIEQLYAQESILAHQAAQGISNYFRNYEQTLAFFCRDRDVIHNNEQGQRLLREWFLSQSNQLLSVTRVNAEGRIIYTHPEEQAIGRDIADQPHMRLILTNHRPVISEVFKSVQGFQCVVLHLPVFDDGQFAGTVAALFPFEAISREHVAGIRVGNSGSCFLLSREGIELYCPVPGHVPQPISETSKGFGSVMAMADRMTKGETGRCAYDYNTVGGKKVASVYKLGFFMPIPLQNTFWSICVNAPEEEALLFIRGFRDRWIIGVVFLLASFGVWGVFLARAFLTIHRERSRHEAEAQVREAEREREKVLAESEARFRTYFEDSLIAMAITSPQKRYLEVNDRFVRLLGYSKGELSGIDWTQLTHPDDLERNLKEYDRMLAGEIDGFSMEKRFLRRDRTIVYTILSVRLIRKTDGTPDYCLVQLQDISDRIRAEADRKRLEEELRQSQKLEAIGQLAGGVAHDFNNLLTVQIGNLGLIRDTAGLPPEVREAHAEIEKSALSAAQLTRQLLAFSRRQMLRIQRLDLNEVIGQLLKMLRRLLREDISLELRLSSSALWLDADASMMEQVVMNLVVNARDAMPTGGQLTLSTQAVIFTAESLPERSEARPGSFVCVCVADTGHGMDVTTRERIFEPFFTTKELGKGTGLGLATVYGIVKQHHGWIDVESAPNRGSVFRVFYPAAAVPEPSLNSQDKPDEAVEHRGSRETILLVEDNPLVCKTMSATLKRLNYDVVNAPDSTEALRLWAEQRQHIRALLTDMVMPNGTSGLELARRLRADRPDLPVIIMSGHSQELLEGGLLDDMMFLPKPCGMGALAEALQKCLRSIRS